MKADPSKSLFRQRLQTTIWCCSKELWYWAIWKSQTWSVRWESKSWAKANLLMTHRNPGIGIESKGVSISCYKSRSYLITV